MTTGAEVETHHHELIAVIRYVTTDDGPGTVWGAICEALEPWHDPWFEAVELTVLDGATWTICPECREEVRVDQ